MVARELPDLSADVWGVAVVTACADLGLIDGVREPASAEALAAGAGGGLTPRLVARLLDVLVALGLVERRGEAYVAAPALADRSAPLLAADGATTVLQAPDLVRRAAARELGEDGWRHTDPAVLQAQGTMSAGAV